MKPALLVFVSSLLAAASLAQAPDAKPPEATPPAAAAPAAPPTPADAPKPRATPTPAPVLEGTVRTPDAKPVEKALVLAEPLVSTMRERGLVVGRTDGAGKFRLTLTRAGPHRLRVEAPGWAAATVKDVGAGAVVALTLQKGETIEGTFRDGTSGAPLPNATVEATDEGNRVYAPWEPGAGTVKAKTNDRGQFRLEGLVPGLHTVSAYLRGFNRARRASVPSGGRVDLYAFAGAVLSGLVRDAQERPVAGAVVRVEGEVRGWSPTAPVVAADANGRYEVAGLSPGTFRVVARHPDFAPTWVPGVSVERGGEVEIDVVMQRAGRVSGRLVAGEDRPVPGRVGLQETDDRPVPSGLDDAFRGEAGEDGRFQVTLPPGEHVLAVVAPGYTPRRVEVNVGTGGSPVDVGDVVLEPGLTIRGHVRDKGGVALAGVQLWGGPFGGMGIDSGPVEAVTEADGTFVLGGLSPGLYRIGARAPGYGEQNQRVEAGAASAEFVLDRAGTITGLVVDDAGSPIEAFRVMARPVREMGPTAPSPRSENFAAADGRFTLADVPEGTWVVEASAPDRANGVVSDIRLGPGGSADAGRIRLTAGGTVRGIVVDGGGAPVPGATVIVQGAAQEWFGQGREASTDPGGTFEVRGVAAGMVEAIATHPSYAQGRSSSVEVDPTRGQADVRIVMSQGGRIEGRVIRRDGTGVSAMVNASVAGPGGRRSFSPPSSVNTGPDGSFVLEHVPAGRVFLAVLTGSSGLFESRHTRELEVREGETTTAEFVSREILVSGHVTRSGAPAPGLRLRLFSATGRTMMMAAGGMGGLSAPPSGPQRLTGVTDENGAFALLVDEPGKHYVNVSTADDKVTFNAPQVEIPDADAYTMDLAFSGVPVSGVVVDRETEQPVANASVRARLKEGNATAGGGGAMTGADGRFVLELEPGDYTVAVSSEGYAGEHTDVSVTSGGGSDLRVALSHGGFIAGRVVDQTGRGVGGLMVSATGGDGVAMVGGMGHALPDGSFRIEGLAAGTYTLAAQSGVGGFAVRTDVSLGQEGVTLTLRPGGRVQVRVVQPDGAPASKVYLGVARVGGRRIMLMTSSPTTGNDGLAEIIAPAATVEIEARRETLKGTAIVDVGSGTTVAAEITLAPQAAGPVKP